MKIFVLNLILLALEAFVSFTNAFQYKCNDLEWVNYLLDDAPAQDGVYMGDVSPGVPAFAGYGIFNSPLGTAYGPGRIQITEPKGIISHRAPAYLSNDTSTIFYLKNNSNYKFEWVVSGHGEIFPFGVETKLPMINGFHDFIARWKVSDTKTIFGAGDPGKGVMYYADLDFGYPNTLGSSRNYEVLTCKSKRFSQPQPLPPKPSPPPINPSTDCVHEWRLYNNDDAPEREGISAGLYDVGTQAYVGKIFDGDIFTAARIQTQEPGRGTYATTSGNYTRFDSGAYYLYNNPNYHYYWVDSFLFPKLSNPVTIPLAENSNFGVRIARFQFGNQFIVARAGILGLPYAADGIWETYYKNYQTLVCDPRPANPCKQVWKKYANDDAPSNDGFKVDFYKNGIMSYIGRSDNNYGRVQISPLTESGVYTLQSVHGGEKFDPYLGEYLVKNPGDLYEWINSHTGEKIKNALKVPTSHASECCHDGNQKESAYIGRFYLDNVVYIGMVYERQGLAFVDMNGNKKVVSSYQVLTCNSPIYFEEEEE